jgi:hypothetical protein
MNTTLNSTTAAGVSRKLHSLGFETYTPTNKVGYKVHNDLGSILVVHWGYSPSTAAEELAAAGYIVEDFRISESPLTGTYQELFRVVGRVEA